MKRKKNLYGRKRPHGSWERRKASVSNLSQQDEEREWETRNPLGALKSGKKMQSNTFFLQNASKKGKTNGKTTFPSFPSLLFPSFSLFSRLEFPGDLLAMRRQGFARGQQSVARLLLRRLQGRGLRRARGLQGLKRGKEGTDGTEKKSKKGKKKNEEINMI